MKRIIAIANQKGGAAKTTTAAVLGVLLSRRGEHVHLIDMDPQSSLTSAFGLVDLQASLLHALLSQAALPALPLGPHLTLTPSSIDLLRAETQLIAEVGREFFLARCLSKTTLKPSTTVILDCPPSLGVLAINCLAASSGLCVVVQPGGFELRALSHLEQTVRALRAAVNPDLTVVGAILTNCHVRRGITEQIAEEIAPLYPILGQVRTDARLLYATTSGTLLKLTRSAALDDYATALNRLIEVAPWLENRSAA
jgi:chromosome partitioning protein